jgi:FAD/FMN-containing dehydrogenase
MVGVPQRERRAALTISAQLTEALRRDLRGPLLLPGEDGYDERLGFNRVLDSHPALVVGATGPEDVAAAVRLAADQGLPVAVKGTGHGASVPSDGGLLLTTERMAHVSVDADARTARIGAGTVWGQVIQEAAKVGLAPLSGSSPGVGAVGYTTGGGLPLMGRTFGWAADRVRSAEVVTADGELRTASPEADQDLYWAVRGGKGNVGVVTELELELVPVAELYGGSLIFPGEASPAVLGAYRDWVGDLPEQLTSSIALMRLPDLPLVPEPLRGRFIVAVRICFVGGADEGAALVEPLRAVGDRILDGVGPMPYTDTWMINMDPTDPLPARDATAVLAGLGDQEVDLLLQAAGPGVQTPLLMVEVRHLGGALAGPPAAPSAIGHRDAPFSLFALAPAFPGTEEMVTGGFQALRRTIAPVDTGKVLINMLGPDSADPASVRRAYEPEIYRRLAALKAVYDPANLFRLNHNIPPEASTG